MNPFSLFIIFCSIVAIKPQKLLTIERVFNTSAVIKCEECSLQTDKAFQFKISNKIDPELKPQIYEVDKDVIMVEVDNLSPGTAYLVKLIAISTEGNDELDQAQFTTKPNPPTNVKFLHLNETDINLEWTAPQSTMRDKRMNTYLIALANDSQNILDYSEIVNQKQLTNKTFSNLTPGKTYILVILNSVDVDKSISVSDPLYTRFRTRPEPPTDLSVDQNSIYSNSFHIRWSPSTKPSEFNGYSVSYQFKDEIFTKFIDKEEKTSIQILESVYPGVYYLIKLNSVSQNHDKSQKSISRPVYCQLTTPPLPVINLKVKAIGKTELYIEWEDSPNSTQDSYMVSYWETSSEKHHVHITNNTHLHLSNLLVGANYSISVVALSNNIHSHDSNIYQLIQTASFKLISVMIALLIASLFGVIITGTFLYRQRNQRTKETFEEDEEQAQGLVTLETTHSPTSNEYTTIESVIDQVPQIDESIRINRNDLELNDNIGKGQFGIVYSGLILMKNAQLSHKEPVAIKTSNIKNHDRDMDSFLKEALIMKNFDHKNVISLIGVSLDPDGSPLVVLPLLRHGDLLQYIRNEKNQPSVKLLINFAIDVAKGMEYLSGQQFIHRDLAARNCMLDNDLVVKIADFGLSRHLKSNDIYISDNSKQLLPIRWMSIESVEKGVYDTKTDVWSYGVLVWEILTRGVNPYSELNNREVLGHLKAGHRLPQPLYCPDQIYGTLLSCWQVNPNDRPTFSELALKFQDIIDSLERRLREKPIEINEANIYYNLAQ